MCRPGNGLDAFTQHLSSRFQAAKYSTLLLCPGEVYLADFGISDDRSHADSASTDFAAGYTWGYAAPEIVSESRNNPEKGDVYALGCVFLHILSAICGPNTEQTTTVWGANQHHGRENQFRVYQLKTGDCYHLTIPQELIKFILPMFNDDRDKRPTNIEVDGNLRKLGGSEGTYHGSCCRNKNSVLQDSEVLQSSDDTDALPQMVEQKADVPVVEVTQEPQLQTPSNMRSDGATQTYQVTTKENQEAAIENSGLSPEVSSNQPNTIAEISAKLDAITGAIVKECMNDDTAISAI